MVMDGESWTVEGVRNGVYHKVQRESPSEGPVFELGSAFWDLASIFHYPYH